MAMMLWGGTFMLRALSLGAAAVCLSSSPAMAYRVTRDLPYDSPGSWPEGATVMDLYTPNSGIMPGAPTIIDVHGGGYTIGDKRDEGAICSRLADRGFNVLSINYTLADQYHPSFPQPIRDVKAVMRWVRTTGVQMGLSPTIVLTGSSAGSTICVAAGLSEGVADFEVLEPPPNGGYHVDAVVGLFGRYDLVWDATTNGSPPPIITYLGGSYTQSLFRPLYTSASAISYVNPCTPPTKLIHGDVDALVPYQHSIRLANALSTAGIYNILQIVHGAGHGTGVLGDPNFVSDAIATSIPQLLAHQPNHCDRNMANAPPLNDGCESALPLTAGGSVDGSTLGASGLISTNCGSGTDTRDVWYEFIAPATRRYTFDTITASPSFDTTIAVYTSCSTSSGMIDCDSDSAGQWNARLQVSLAGGQRYLVRISGVNGSAGPFTLHADTGAPLGDPPPNDLCVEPAQAYLGANYGTTVGATGSNNSLCGTYDQEDVWFRFLPDQSAIYRFDTEGSTLLPHTTISLYGDCDSQPLSCNAAAYEGAAFASLDLPMYSGQAVLIRVAADAVPPGPFRLNVNQLPGSNQGACCGPQGCDIRTQATCSSNLWYPYLTCSVAPCAPPPAPGACCQGTACSMVADLSGCGGSFLGAGTACGTTDNPTACCPANFNDQGGVTVQDIFDFLAAYFGGLPRADFNSSGAITVQDIFDFLSAYFTGCP